jgi:hypothetical protein
MRRLTFHGGSTVLIDLWHHQGYDRPEVWPKGSPNRRQVIRGLHGLLWAWLMEPTECPPC